MTSLLPVTFVSVRPPWRPTPSTDTTWRPLRRTATYADAVAWAGVEYSGGDWLILEGAKSPQLAYCEPGLSHRWEVPADLTHLKRNSPPPTPEELRDWQGKWKAAKDAAALRARPKPPPESKTTPPKSKMTTPPATPETGADWPF